MVLRLLHVVPTYLPATRYGGPIYSVHGLCKGLAAAGHEICVYTTNVNGESDSPVPLKRETEIDGVRITYFPSRHLRRLFWCPSMAHALSNGIGSFDLVHLHSVFLWPTWMAARAARAARVPYVLSPRGMLVKALVARKSRWLKSAWLSLIERRNVEAAAAVHVTSAIEARDLRQFGFKLPQVVTVPNGVDEPQGFHDDDVGQDIRSLVEMDRLILSLGRINWKKGLDRLIGAMSQIPEAHVAIVGNDEEGLVPRLMRQAETLGVADRVSFVPRSVAAGDKEALFAAASVFVLPSLSENFGNVVLEAMIRGCPVIASREVGAADIAVNAETGLVFDGSAVDLAAKISRILNDPEKARHMGEAGRREADAHFRWPVIARQMAACYEAILERPRDE